MPLARKVETATLARVSKVKVTCSAARSIKRKGVSAAPLRSPQHPMGLPSLQGSDLEKVFAANKIYVGLANFLDLLCSLKIPWTVENPESSLLWQLPCFEHLVRAYPRVSFDMCCYGGARLMHRSLLTSSAQAQRDWRSRCVAGTRFYPRVRAFRSCGACRPGFRAPGSALSLGSTVSGLETARTRHVPC